MATLTLGTDFTPSVVRVPLLKFQTMVERIDDIIGFIFFAAPVVRELIIIRNLF